MSEWWAPSRGADLLSAQLSRQDPPPVSTSAALDSKFAVFKTAYFELLDLLKRDGKSVEEAEKLTDPPLSQTLDEYNDFRYDAGDGTPFSKRKLETASPPYAVARYVYTDADIRQLDRKLDWQIRIMVVKMEHMVLDYFMRVSKGLQVRRGSMHHDSSSMGSVLLGSIPDPTAVPAARPSREDEIDPSITQLWERVNYVRNRAANTGPHITPLTVSNDAPPKIDVQEISSIIKPLKARFQNKIRSDYAISIASMDEARLEKYSQVRLEDLLRMFPSFATRKRVYSKQERTEDSGSVATIIIVTRSGTVYEKREFNLLTLDIVNSMGQRVIVCTDERANLGAVHYLPQRPIIYPCTDPHRIAPSTHDTLVYIEELRPLDLTGTISRKFREARVSYNLPQKSAWLALQSEVRGRLLRHALDVDFIDSKRGRETNSQHLKIWSDLNEENYMLSFYIKREDAPGTDLEFPLACFLRCPPDPFDGEPRKLRLYFRLPPESPVPKRRSASKASASSSSNTSPTQSMLQRLGRSHRSREKHLSVSPPSGSVSPRDSDSGPVTVSQSESIYDTSTGSMATSPPTLDPNVHRDAKEIHHLDLKFSFASDAEFFLVEFPKSASRKNSRVHFRTGSIYDEPVYGPLLPSPIATTRNLFECPQFGTTAEPGKQSGVASHDLIALPNLNFQTGSLGTAVVGGGVVVGEEDDSASDLGPRDPHYPALLPAAELRGVGESIMSMPVVGIAIPRESETETVGGGQTGISLRSSPPTGIATPSRTETGPRRFSNPPELKGQQEFSPPSATSTGSRRVPPSSESSCQQEFPPLSSAPTDYAPPSRRETGSAPTSRTGTGFATPSRSETGSLSTNDYHVGWVCAVKVELVVARELLDTKLPRPFDLPEDDDNSYVFGTIGDHHVVITALAKGKYGNTSAASVASHMQRSFKDIQIRLMVGIAGGAPSSSHDIRLGDVVVSTPTLQRGGVFKYDFGKAIQNKEFVTMGSLDSPPGFLLSAVTNLEATHDIEGHRIKSTVETMLERNPRLREHYQKPDLQNDVLYKSSFTHPQADQSCKENCFPRKDEIRTRSPRDTNADDPVIHYGLVASGDKLMKDAMVRDALAEKEEVLCFEMEAAGLMGHFRCLVIRGICDYADTHKNDQWQGYAAAVAAAYAKELLLLALTARNFRKETAAPEYYEAEY